MLEASTTAQRRVALCGALHESTDLVAQMADPRQWQEWLRVPLYHAAATGHASNVLTLLSAGANGGAGFRDHRGSTLMHAAASGGSVAILSALLDAGGKADVNIRESLPPRRTPLHCAAANGHRDLARALIGEGSDPEATDSKCQTALHLASLGGHADLVSDLLELGLNADAKDADGNTPLALAVAHGRLETLQLLLRAGASTQTSSESMDPLGVALKEGFFDCMRALLAAGVNLEAVDQIGLTALLSATRASKTVAIAALVEAGANVDGRGGTMWTPLVSPDGRCTSIISIIYGGTYE